MSDHDHSDVSGAVTEIRLKNLCKINPKKSEVSDRPPSTEVSFVSLDGFSRNGKIKNKQTKTIEEVYSGYTYFREGDVVIAKITPSFENGKGAICRDLQNGIGFGTTELHVLRPREGVSADFIWYILRSEPFGQSAIAAMRGVAGQQRIPTEFLEDFSITVAPKNQRENVINHLNKATGSIYDSIKTLDVMSGLVYEKENAIIHQETTGATSESEEMEDTHLAWLQKIPKRWSTVKLKHICKKPITYGIVQAGPDVESGIPYIRVSDMSGNQLPKSGYLHTSREIHEQYSRSVVYPGDLVMAIRATVGKVMQVPDYLPEANLTQGTARICPGERVESKYLLYLLKSLLARQHFDSLSKGATFDEVTLKMVRNYEVPLPPLDEQRAIVDRIENQMKPLKELERVVSQCIELCNQKRRAIITAAVTGQIDVDESRGDEIESTL